MPTNPLTQVQPVPGCPQAAIFYPDQYIHHMVDNHDGSGHHADVLEGTQVQVNWASDKDPSNPQAEVECNVVHWGHFLRNHLPKEWTRISVPKTWLTLKKP